jgi:hypothetical protein
MLSVFPIRINIKRANGLWRLTNCSTRRSKKMSLLLALPENDTLVAGKTMSQWCRAVVLTRRRRGQLTQVHSPDQHL